VPSAHTVVRGVDENAFASIVQARPCLLFGRPVHLRDSSHRLPPGASPQTHRIPPRGGHPVLPNQPLGPVRHYPHFWISARGLGLSGTLTRLRHTLPGTHYAWLRLPPAPLGSLRLALAAQYLGCFLGLCSLVGSVAAGSSLPPPGLLVSRYPCSSGILNKETDGSLQFPSYPLECMPRS
jgi:hypothetical protein